MTPTSLPTPSTSRKVLVMTLLLLPVGCLVWRWSEWPAQVPWHFSRQGADAYADKHLLVLLVGLPALLYWALPMLYRQQPPAQRAARTQLSRGVALVLSLLFCVWLLLGIPTH